MKKSILTLCVLFMFTACGGGVSSQFKDAVAGKTFVLGDGSGEQEFDSDGMWVIKERVVTEKGAVHTAKLSLIESKKDYAVFKVIGKTSALGVELNSHTVYAKYQLGEEKDTLLGWLTLQNSFNGTPKTFTLKK